MIEFFCDRCCFLFCSRRGGIRHCQRQQNSTGGCWKVRWKSLGKWTSITYNDLSSWWLNQPIRKNITRFTSQIGIIFPKISGWKSKKTFELPPLSYWCQWWPIDIIIWVFPKIWVPQNGWFIMEHPFKMDDLGGTIIFRKHPYVAMFMRHHHIFHSWHRLWDLTYRSWRRNGRFSVDRPRS